MPIAGWKVHFVWQVGALAVAEDYYYTGVADDPLLTIYPGALALYKARSLMMGNAVVPVTFRISQLGTFRSFVNANPADIAGVAVGPLLLGASLNAQQVAAGISANQDGSAGQAPDAVVANFLAGPSNHARKFLGGVPDVLERTNPLGPWIVGVPSWLTVFNAWVAILLNASNKWAFKARTQPTVAPLAPLAVQRVQLDPGGSGFWGVEVATFAGGGIAAGATLQLRGFKMTSRAIMNFNGTYQVNSTAVGTDPGTTWYYLRGSQNLSGSAIALMGNARGVDFSLFLPTNITVGKQTTHKRGNRSLASPGRRRIVQRVFS